MSEVVPFPAPSRGGERRDGGPSDRAADAQAARREWERRVADNLARRPRMVREGERVVVARNLWRLLDRIEREHGIAKARVVRAAGQGGEGDSTKRLWRFALRPDLDEAAANARAKDLTQDVRKYAGIAEAAARLAGLPVDECLRDLLSGSPYVVFSDELPKVEPWAETLAGLLNAMGRAIARDHELAGYFAFTTMHALRATKAWGDFEPGDFETPTPSDLRDGGVTSDSDLCLLLPKVYVGETEIRRDVQAELVPSSRPELPDAPRWQDSDFISRLGRTCPIPGAPRVPAEVRISSRLWLCLAPVGPGREVVPVFMEQRCFTVFAKAEGSSLHYGDILGEPPARSWIPLERNRHREDAPRFVDALRIKESLPRERTPSWAESHWSDDWRYIESVTGNSCQSFLGVEGLLILFDDLDREDALGSVWDRTPYDWWRVRATGEAPPHTIAAAVENNLLYAEDEARIEARLARSAACRVGALNAWRRWQETAAAQAREELLRRWSHEPGA